MSGQHPSLLLVGSSEATAAQVRAVFSGAEVTIALAEPGLAAMELLERSAVDLVIVDAEHAASPLELLRALRTRWRDLPIVLLAQPISLAEIAETVAVGVTDLLTRPIALEQLAFALRKALLVARRSAAAPPPPPADAAIVFGRSPAMQGLRELLCRVAPTSATILVRGESGTGKELVARSLHRLSTRADAPLVKIDCASLPENLIESELFGYEKGAFTGATSVKPGRVELANGGTLFLDEVGELALPTQAKLLRLLQDRELERLGGTKTVRVDVRVIAATHRDLETMVEQGSFREDLLYRLNGLPLWIAPLRARRVDVEDLAQHFCAEFARELGKPPASIQPEALRVLVTQRWPGNVRQLQNFVERLVVLSTGSEIAAADVERELSRPVRFETETGPAGADAAEPSESSPDSSSAVPLNRATQAAERAALVRALKHTGGNRSAAARLLSISRTTLYTKLETYGLL